MHETEGFNFSVSNLSEDKKNKKTLYKFENPTLSDIIQFIKNKELSEDLEDKLIKIAKNTPHGSLATFRKNYKLYLRKNNGSMDR